MNDNICIPKSYFLVAILILVGFTFFHSMRMEKILPKYENNLDNKVSKKNKISTPSPISDDEKYDSIEDVKPKKLTVPKKILYLNRRDENSLYNDFKPPERRLPRNNYPEEPIISSINVPTRGYPDNYHNMGMLVRKNDEKVLKLFGRQKFPGSNQYEYYVIGNDSTNLTSKIPLKIPGEKELSNNDTVPIPWLDQSKGKFEVKLFDYDVPRYNPYLY